jgi:subtilisin family serine protease
MALLPGLASAADDSVWVRIHHPAEDPALDRVAGTTSLADYGSFQWGPVSPAERDRLERLGLRLTAERNPFVITLGGERFDPLSRVDQGEAETTQTGGQWHLVQFEGPVRSEWLAALNASGVKIAQPIHPFSYFVWADSAQVSALRSVPARRWSGAMQTNWKVQPHLRDLGSEIRPTMALASAHADQRRLLEDLAGLGRVHAITPLNAHFNIVHLDLPGERYERLAEVPAIFTVQYIRPETGPRGEMSNQSIVGNIDSDDDVLPGYVDWLTATGYNGAGVTVGVVDGGIRTSHNDLAGRIAPCVQSGDSPTSCSSANNGHGTHVAGAVAGTGATGALLNEFLRGQGVAPGASVIQQRYPAFTGAGPGSMIPDGMLKIYRESALSGALLTNNSWGPTQSPQGYDIPTQQIDFISRDADPNTPGDQPVLAVWSIMNGGGDRPTGACAPSSLGSPDEAKNLFAVGSTALQESNGAQVSNIFRISTNSAHGNACDGRRVPHIVAPGCSTDSTTASSDASHSAGFCGTSMASPVVSGAVAVWSEKYREQTGTNPSPALTKAVFTAVAQDLGGNPNADGGIMGHRPDRFQGYGRIDLDEVMNHPSDVFLVDQQTVFDAVGQEWATTISAADPSRPMRIMLAWTDAPGSPTGGLTEAWVNNLDLSVEVAEGLFLGNVIGGDGWSATGGSSDSINNLEGVFLTPEQHGGAVQITVTASDLLGDALDPWNPGAPRQDFALACYNCVEGEPGFRLALTPEEAQLCLPESGSVEAVPEALVSVVGDYAGSVSLQAAGLPAGVNSTLAPTQVAAPGSADWTLEGQSTAAPGTYLIDLVGDDGTEQKSVPFELTLIANLGAGPELEAPTDGASDLVLDPAFVWQGIAGAKGYRFQLAGDEDFSDLLADQTTGQTGLMPDLELELETTYFWRVGALNACGDRLWSKTSSFTTRLEPVAALSTSELSFVLGINEQTDDELLITNTGTGNLVFDIESDQASGTGSGTVFGAYDPELDENLDVPAFSVTGASGGGPVIDFEVPGGLTSSGTVVGFSFEGTVVGASSGSNWASDLRLVITSPEGASFDVGGYEDTENEWAFQGQGSANDGTYTSQHVPAFGPQGTSDEGSWQLSFFHDWESDSAETMDWSDVTITLHKQPLPQCRDELTNVSWLNVDPASGSVPADESRAVSVNVDSAEFIPDTYTGYLCIDTNDPRARPAIVEVELRVVSDPIAIAEVEPASFDLRLLDAPSTEAALDIGNRGNADLSWSITTALPPASADDAGAAGRGPGGDGCAAPVAIDWLNVSPSSGNVGPGAGGTLDTVGMTIDASGLAVGAYDALLCIATNDPAKPLIEVPVHLTILGDPVFDDRFED